MSLEAINDFAGDISEGIKDVVVDIGEFSKNAMENIGEQGMQALENGDIRGAIECSDMPEEHKEIATSVIEQIGLNKGQVVSALKIAGGALGTIAALATPGFQPAGIAAAGAMIDGINDLIALSDSKNANAVANA